MKVLPLLAALMLFSSFSFAQDKPVFLADTHISKGVKCEACHGKEKEPAEPTIQNCTVCHPTGALVEKTKNVQPKNPHVSPHYQDKLDCINCHYGHEKSVNF